jgi:hypothetical protein
VTTAKTEFAAPVPTLEVQLKVVPEVQDVLRQVVEPSKAVAVKSELPRFNPLKVITSPPEVGAL